MMQFSYVARDWTGKQVRGVVQAATVHDAREELRRQDLFALRLSEQQERAIHPSRRAGRRRKISLSDMVVMSRQLATLVGAGMPLVECFGSLAIQTENPALADVIRQLRVDVLSGVSLAEALNRQPKVFNPLFRALVNAGEAAGRLEEVLEDIADQFEKEAELNEKIRSAFVYPILLIITAIGVVAFLLVFVIPVFAQVYAQFRAELPLPTRLLILISGVFMRYWWVLALALGGGLGWLRHRLKTMQGRRWLDALKLRLPLFGPLARKAAIVRFVRTLGALVDSGVPILQSLITASHTMGNIVMAEAVTRVVASVQEGARISTPLEEAGEFPAMVSQMVAAGEDSGRLGEMLHRLAGFYEREVRYTIDRITRLMEPIMTTVLGCIVLFVLIALYMPIFNLSNVIH